MSKLNDFSQITSRSALLPCTRRYGRPFCSFPVIPPQDARSRSAHSLPEHAGQSPGCRSTDDTFSRFPYLGSRGSDVTINVSIENPSRSASAALPEIRSLYCPGTNVQKGALLLEQRYPSENLSESGRMYSLGTKQ